MLSWLIEDMGRDYFRLVTWDQDESGAKSVRDIREGNRRMVAQWLLDEMSEDRDLVVRRDATRGYRHRRVQS